MMPEAQGARLQAGTLLVQRQGRPLRGVPGRRRDRDRDALPARRLRDVRAVQGRRYNRETLEITYRGKSIADVLDLTVDQALPLLENIPRDRQQAAHARRTSASATSRSASRRRRCRRRSAAREAREGAVEARHRPHALRPRRADHRSALRGHRASCSTCSTKLVDQGNTVVVIEHNLDVIKCADWVIDLGPEGGARRRPDRRGTGRRKRWPHDPIGHRPVPRAPLSGHDRYDRYGRPLDQPCGKVATILPGTLWTVPQKRHRPRPMHRLPSR